MATPPASTSEAAHPSDRVDSSASCAPTLRPRLVLIAAPYELESGLMTLLEREHQLDCRFLESAFGLAAERPRRGELTCLHECEAAEPWLEELDRPSIVIGRALSPNRVDALLAAGASCVYDLASIPLKRIAELLAIHARSHAKREARLHRGAALSFEAVAEPACFAVIEWDRELRILRWSDEAETLLGIPKGEAVGRSLGKWLLPGEDSLSFLSGCHSLSSGILGNFKGDCALRRSDGQALAASWKVTPADAAGGAYIAIFELRSRFLEGRQSLGPATPLPQAPVLAEPPAGRYHGKPGPEGDAGFSQRAEFLANAVEQLSIGVYLKDEQEDGVFTVWNTQMERLFEIPKEQVLGKRVEDIFDDPLLRAFLSDARPPHSRNRAIVPRASEPNRGPSNFIADITKTPILDESGVTIAVIGVVRDITERIQSENRLVTAFNELEASKEKLEQSNLEIRKGIEKAKKLAVAAQASNKAKSFFLSNISHELRTPLTSIVSLTHALLEGTFGPMNPKQKEYLEIVSDSSKHLQALITDILDLSKIELGKLNLKVARTPVVEIAQASLRMVMQQAQAKNVQCLLRFKSKIESIDVDPKRLRQVLLNLLFNAVKFTRPETTISLSISGTSRDEWVTFQVSDEGIGIQEHDIEKIFMPFTQLDDSLSKHYEGTGLGLAIVSKLVELHGGGLSVASVADKGSTFRIRLPIHQPEEGDSLAGPALAEAALFPPQEPFALMVEENERLALQLQAELQRAGCPLAIATLPNELAAYYDQLRPSLIIVDLATLASHGAEWIPLARDHPQWSATLWIATSSLDIRASHRLAAKLGFDRFVPRPLTRLVLNGLLPPTAP